jgi:ribosomal protein L7/L12
MSEHKFNTLYDEAVMETETARHTLIQSAYIDKLEKRVIELEDKPAVTQEQVNKFMRVLNEIPVHTYGPESGKLGKIWRIKILRAAYNLGLKEAKDMVELWDSIQGSADLPLPF